MKNKKAYIDPSWIFVIMAIIGLAFVLSMSVLVYIDQEKHESQCKSDCKEYKAIFRKLNYNNQECWCSKGGMPFRAW